MNGGTRVVVPDYIPAREATRLLGVTSQTLRVWDKEDKIKTNRTPGGTRLYNRADVYRIAGIVLPVEEKSKIAYCRVSTSKQLDDLERQKDFFRSEYPDHELVTDIGSGINWKRKGLRSILERSLSGTVEEVVVAHRDRLARFSFELIEFILEKEGVKLVVHDRTDSSSKEDDLSEDIMSIIHIYSCRKMGRRRYSHNKNPAISESESEGEAQDSGAE